MLELQDKQTILFDVIPPLLLLLLIIIRCYHPINDGDGLAGLALKATGVPGHHPPLLSKKELPAPLLRVTIV